jgi:hypothetical protein
MVMIDQLLQYIGQLVLYGGGAVAIAYAAFRTLTVKWLDNRFAERLASYKHAQAKEIEELRFQINSLFDRLTKLHQKEFEVLPEAWARLYDAYWKAASFLACVRSYPDLDKMTEAHRNEFIQSCKLLEWQKAEVREAANKGDCYQKFITWHEFADAQEAAIESHTYVQTNGIFLTQEMRDQFNRVDDLIWKALKARESILKNGYRSSWDDKVTAFEEEAKPLIKELEEKVRRRLHE